jgi:hypothetical protein
MAKVIPSGVLKLPNFAELDYNLRKQREQDELKGQEFLSKFEDIQGSYLPGDIDIVQGAADFFADTIEAAAVDPNDPKLRLKVDRAYRDWVKKAGAAQANFNSHQELRKDFYLNPSNYAISSAEGVDILNSDANNKRTVEQLFAMVSNPESRIPLAVKQEIKTADSYVDKIVKAFNSRKNDFYDQNGILKEKEFNEWLSGAIKNNFLDEPSKLNALLAESISKGDIGVDGKLKPEDIRLVNSTEFINENKESYIPDFQQRISQGVKDLVQQTSMTPSQIATTEYTRARTESLKGDVLPQGKDTGDFTFDPIVVSNKDNEQIILTGFKIVDGEKQFVTEKRVKSEDPLSNQVLVETNYISENDIPNLNAQLETGMKASEWKKYVNTLNSEPKEDPSTDTGSKLVESDEDILKKQELARTLNQYEDELAAASDGNVLSRIGVRYTEKGGPLLGLKTSKKSVREKYKSALERIPEVFKKSKGLDFASREERDAEIKKFKDEQRDIVSNENSIELINSLVERGNNTPEQLSIDQQQNLKILIDKQTLGMTPIEKEVYINNLAGIKKSDLGFVRNRKSKLPLTKDFKALLSQARSMTNEDYDRLKKELKGAGGPKTLGSELQKLEEERKFLENSESLTLKQKLRKNRIPGEINDLRKEIERVGADTTFK